MDSETAKGAPVVGRVYPAETATRAGHKVLVEVTSVECETAEGWVVWGYRQYPKRAQHARKTGFARQYVIVRRKEQERR